MTRTQAALSFVGCYFLFLSGQSTREPTGLGHSPFEMSPSSVADTTNIPPNCTFELRPMFQLLACALHIGVLWLVWLENRGRFLVFLVVFSHLPGPSIYQKGHLWPCTYLRGADFDVVSVFNARHSRRKASRFGLKLKVVAKMLQTSQKETHRKLAILLFQTHVTYPLLRNACKSRESDLAIPMGAKRPRMNTSVCLLIMLLEWVAQKENHKHHMYCCQGTRPQDSLVFLPVDVDWCKPFLEGIVH